MTITIDLTPEEETALEAATTLAENLKVMTQAVIDAPEKIAQVADALGLSVDQGRLVPAKQP